MSSSVTSITWLFLLLACLAVASIEFTTAGCSSKPAVFYLAGDSTTAKQSSGGGGWGNGFLSFLKSPARGTNYGHNGATTESFVKGGDWGKVISQVKNSTADGDVFVTIQVSWYKSPSRDILCDVRLNRV
jgi:hypothetical protein